MKSPQTLPSYYVLVVVQTSTGEDVDELPVGKTPEEAVEAKGKLQYDSSIFHVTIGRYTLH